jgi:hypothetical protein
VNDWLSRMPSRALLGICLLSSAVVLAAAGPAGGDTDPTALVGEGGSFLTPVTDILLKADPGLAPLNPSYTDANLDNAISDFAGSAPGSFSADFVVSERPLTSNEASTAKSNGRTFAYVPFAATPVAVATLAPCSPVTGNSTAALCNNIPLTTTLVGLLFTYNQTNSNVSPNQGLANSLSGWSDPRLSQANGHPIPNSGIFQASTLEPSAENTALMAYLDSDPTSKELVDNALNNPNGDAATHSDTPSEIWPFQGSHAFVGGDAGLIGKELNLNAETDAPSTVSSWNLGDVFPLSSVWAGSPLGTPWNLAMAALQNAAGKFVSPTETAAASAEGDASMDPATNLVTFAANPNNETAYNNYMMVESYLVVPTSGLTAAKAQKLAQYIRFVVGPVAQSDEVTLGSAPPTPTMVAADLKVATELDAESTANATSVSTSTTTTTAAAGSAAASSTPATSSSGVALTGDSGGAIGNSGSPQLASTGTGNETVPLFGAGGVLVVLGVFGRRRLRAVRRPGTEP